MFEETLFLRKSKMLFEEIRVGKNGNGGNLFKEI